MNTLITALIGESIATKQAMLNDPAFVAEIEATAAAWVRCFEAKGKILFCGNGGSAADAQHIAAELSGRFYLDRAPLFAEALHVNSSYLTAVANDYGYEAVYARMVQAAGRTGDILVAFSTSGNSPNILKAIEVAHQIGMQVVGFTGATGGKMADLCDHIFKVPSSNTPRIQEAHILIGHILCQITEKTIFA